MEQFFLKAIGTIRVRSGDMCVALDPEYAPALQGLEDFSHVNILWWFSGCDNERDRSSLTESAPYHGGPAVLGVFATRSPMRPNPIAQSSAGITYIDRENAVIGLAYIDAEDGSPVLDIKPYTPSLDRVENPSVPAWCRHWPRSLEQSAGFDWSRVFGF